MNKETIAPVASVAATAFGEEEAEVKGWALDDASAWAEPPKTEFAVPVEVHCRLSKAGKPTFYADIAAGTFCCCPDGTPADLVGHRGMLTVLGPKGMRIVPSTKAAGFVGFNKRVDFGAFRTIA